MASEIRGVDNFDSAVVNQGLGVGQTWVDYSSTRATGTTYTNSGDRPILVVFTVPTSVGVNYVYLDGFVDSTKIASNCGVSDSNTGYSKPCALQLLVPSGSTYKVVKAGGGTDYCYILS